MKFKIDFKSLVPIIIVQVIEDNFFQLVLGEGKLAHHERIETVANFIA